jgi:PIN domain nuclease of toxin-antitoxin system
MARSSSAHAQERLALQKDPFDRILIAQAKAEGLGLVTSDGPLSDYPVQAIW